MSTKNNFFKLDLRSEMAGSGYVELVKHKRRNKKPKAGDLFGIQVVDFGWIVGRVIMENPSQMPEVESGPFFDSYLIYLYKGLHESCPQHLDLPIRPLLCLPPIIMDRELWTMGYAEPIESCPLEELEILNQHCFYDHSASVVHDEKGRLLSEVSRPCGVSALFLVQGLCSWLHHALNNGFDQENHPLGNSFSVHRRSGQKRIDGDED